ncbi:MAG: fasciclin domain-containing protein [Phototrophicaceae bacterium]
MKHVLSLVGAILLLTMGVIVSAQDATIADIVVEATEADQAEFTILLQLIAEADLVDALSDEDAELTVFAPTDEAFETLLDDADLELDDLLEDMDALTNILLYHIAEGLILAEDLEDGMEIDMLNGATSDITIDEDGLVRINDSAIVVTSDIEASNGIIHVIDTVLSPPAERSMLLPPSPSTGELCSISAESADSARVRVGPGENRTSVTFLPAGQNFPVLGIFEDEDGNTWFQLDKEEAAPGRAINEAWVAATDVDSTGDCDNIAETDAPPIIPISSNQTANTGGGSGNPVINASNNGSTIWIAYAPWAGQLPANLQASSRASADLIVEASDELVNEESCGEYSNAAGQTITVRRYQVAVNVTVIDGNTGATLRSAQFVGGQAPGCPSSLAVNTTLNGNAPSLNQAIAFIQNG